MVSTRDELEKKLCDSDATPMSLPHEFLRAITCDFSTNLILGEGGYGVVYKGVLRNGQIIAVKKLSEMRLREAKFQDEVRYLMGIKHQNIVQFIGYCAESSWEAIEEPSGSGKYVLAEKPKRLLCFQYVPKKSLDKYISDGSLGLEWNTRYEIIKGICNGLHFLHDECHIVHLDLKPENILMDSNMTPKIADFGLSRIFVEKQSRIITESLVGTCGYMAPEYLTHGIISTKTDIFSLGVIFIEIITGHKKYPYFQQDSPNSTATSLQQFKERVLGSWLNKFVSSPKYNSTERYAQQVRQCITIALECVHPNMEKRPTMKEIIRTFNEADQIISLEKTPRIMYALDVNLAEPWIVTAHHDGYIDIWNYDTRKLMASVQTGDGWPVHTIKFIERKQWFIAGSRDGFICVYDYKTEVQKITSFRSETEAHQHYCISSLAVHPTKPYVLTACYPYIKLWDWNKNWECIQTFQEQSRSTYQLTFNPKDTNSFASASSDHTIKIWSLDSIKPKYTLLGHSNRVNCLDFFTRDDRQYLITGSDDKTAKIWDMQTRVCIYTLEGFVSTVISVLSHPSLPVLVTGTLHGAIYLWSSINFRLKRIVNISGYGYAHGLACLTGSRRVVIANESAISIMEIHDEELVAGSG